MARDLEDQNRAGHQHALVSARAKRLAPHEPHPATSAPTASSHPARRASKPKNVVSAEKSTPAKPGGGSPGWDAAPRKIAVTHDNSR